MGDLLNGQEYQGFLTADIIMLLSRMGRGWVRVLARGSRPRGS